MKTTLDWLKRHLDTTASLDEICATLNRIGLEVEGVEDRGKALAPFTVGYVVKAEQHPNADKLRVCIVDTGKGEVQVVCGAPNARTGMKGVFAPAGTHVPGTGLDLKESEIRGVASRGMLCSEREMGLSDEHDGIIDLPADTPVGASFAAIAGLDDPVIEIGVTPDRGDCFGVRGIARDLAAAGLGTLKPLDTTPVAGSYDSPISLRLDFDEATRSACSLFVGRHFRGLTNGPSPAWMQRKLRAVGLRPISALVDITNWLTMDLGRPAHIYDAGKVTGGFIGARLGRPGDRFEGLNGKAYEADPEMTVIYDGSGMLGLGGLLGGESTGADETTSSGFIEIALFDPVRTAATGRKLGLVTDARQRFERGVDEPFAPAGAEIATRLILEICGGEASRPVVAGEVPSGRQVMKVRPSRVASLGGIAIPKDRAEAILADLGFETADAGDDLWRVTVPTWRHDMGCEADVVEEVLRINGFDEVAMVSLPRLNAVARPVLSLRQRRVRWARRALASRGLNEAVTYSFVSSDHARAFGGGNGGLTLVNPISVDMDMMRPSGLVALLEAAARNQARGFTDFGLFEIGPVYASTAPEGQKTAAAGLRVGTRRRPPLGGARPCGRRLRRQGRRDRGAGIPRRPGREPADLGRRPRVVPPRPLRRAASGAEGARHLRRAASRRHRRLRCRWPRGRLRGPAGRRARAQGQGRRPAEAGALALPAGAPRLRLRGRCRHPGREGAARRQRRRPPAHRRGRRFRRLPGRAPGRRPQVARRRGHHPAHRPHHDRRGDRGARRQDRRRGRETHGRHPTGMTGVNLLGAPSANHMR